MTVNDVFSKISARMIEGMMINDKLSNYYDFLSLHGLKRMHEYHFLRDAATMRTVNRYYINHYNELMSESQITAPFSIPASWYSHVRQDIGGNTKRTAIKSAMESWCDFLSETKKMYEQAYKDLCDMSEIAAACKVKELICHVDMDKKCADRLHIELQSTDYDLSTIYLMQDEMHEKYAEKAKEIGVAIC